MEPWINRVLADAVLILVATAVVVYVRRSKTKRGRRRSDRMSVSGKKVDAVSCRQCGRVQLFERGVAPEEVKCLEPTCGVVTRTIIEHDENLRTEDISDVELPWA